MRPTFTTGEAGRKGQHHRHLQEHAEEVADIVGAVLGEALGAIAALQQESLAGRDLAERLRQVARLAGEHQRRKGRQLRLDRGQRRRVRIVRHLDDRLVPPALRASNARPSTRPSSARRVRDIAISAGLYTTAAAGGQQKRTR